MANNICSVCGEKFHAKKEQQVCYRCSSFSPFGTMDSTENIQKYYIEMQTRNGIFRETTKLSVPMGTTVHIDENNKLFYFNQKTDIQLIYRFDDIISYDIEMVGQSQVTKKKGGIGRAVVGGMVAGPVGSIVGATTSKEVTKTTGGVKTLYITSNCLGTQRTDTYTFYPPEVEKFLDKCITIHNNKEARQHSAQTTVNIADELLKYKQLLDSGAITQDEFDNQKQKLLNNNSQADSTVQDYPVYDTVSSDSPDTEQFKVLPTNKKQKGKKKKGCTKYFLIIIAILIAFIIVIGGVMSGDLNNNSSDIDLPSDVSISEYSAVKEELSITDESAYAAFEVFKACNIGTVSAVEHDDMLDDMDFDGEKGFRVKTNLAQNIILYLNADGSVYSLRWADNDLYLDGNVIAKLTDFISQ